MFLMLRRECQKINMNKFQVHRGFNLFENVVYGRMTVCIIKCFLLHSHVNISMKKRYHRLLKSLGRRRFAGFFVFFVLCCCCLVSQGLQLI